MNITDPPPPGLLQAEFNALMVLADSPIRIPEIMRHTLERVFFCGAGHLYNMTVLSGLPNEEALAQLASLQDELTRYFEEHQPGP